MNETSDASRDQDSIADEKRIHDPELALKIMHGEKMQLLHHLVKEAYNIQELKNLTNMNPGTIKRHLDDLCKAKLVFIQRETKNDYNIRMKFYRARAKKFIIEFTVPDDV